MSTDDLLERTRMDPGFGEACGLAIHFKGKIVEHFLMAADYYRDGELQKI